MLRRVSLFLSLLAFSVTSNAAVVTYTDRASFLAATSSATVIDFGGIADPSDQFLQDSIILSGVQFDANVADGNTLYVLDDTFCCPAYSDRGDNVASLSSAVSNQQTNNSFIDITLPDGTTAVGMDLFTVTIGDGLGTSGGTTVNIDIAGGISSINTAPAVPGGTGDEGRVFIGFTSDVPLAFLSVSPTFARTAVNIVDFTFGTAGTPNPVPVPAAIWLFGTALLGLVGFSKRRKDA